MKGQWVGVRVGRRRGLSLVEVLVAAAMLTVVFLPVMFMFLSASTTSGDDIREIKAYRLAEEVMEHIVAIHLLKRLMTPVPKSNEAFVDAHNELDIEALLARYEGQVGAPLYSSGTSMIGSRLYLHPSQEHFHRYLSINYQHLGKEHSYLEGPHLLGVDVRVRYGVPRATGMMFKDVTLSTLLYADAMPPRSEDHMRRFR